MPYVEHCVSFVAKCTMLFCSRHGYGIQKCLGRVAEECIDSFTVCYVRGSSVLCQLIGVTVYQSDPHSTQAPEKHCASEASPSCPSVCGGASAPDRDARRGRIEVITAG